MQFFTSVIKSGFFDWQNLPGGYRYGFNGKEGDDEVKGGGNSYDFGGRIYDPRVGRWLKLDPRASIYPSHSPYVYAANNPVALYDPNGEYIIFVNGEVGQFSGSFGDGHPDRASSSYRSLKFVNRVKKAFDDKHVRYYDGDVGSLPSTRYDAGYTQAKVDFLTIFNSLERDENGKIIESVDMVSHSKGSAWASGFQDGWNEMVNDPEYASQFTDGSGQIGMNLMLAPHQSDYINVETSSTVVVTISHDLDDLSDDDAGSAEGIGDITNIQTDNDQMDVGDTHTIDGFHFEATEAIDAYMEYKSAPAGTDPSQIYAKGVAAVVGASKLLYNRATGKYDDGG